jgi:hypothetical protein
MAGSARFKINHAGQGELAAAALADAGLLRLAKQEDRTMRCASSFTAALATTVLGLLAVPAQAAPATGLAGDLKPIAGESALVEQVRHRCYRHRGHWHCPRHRYRPYYYGPGFSFYFGPRWRHHRNWRHHHRRHWRR